MKNTYYIIISLFFLSFSSNIKSQVTDLVKMNLTANIKELIINECVLNINNGDTAKICKIQEHYFFNKNGFIEKKERYQFSEIQYRKVYKYNLNNTLKHIKNYSNDSVLNTTSYFYYNAKGNIEKEKIFNSDSTENAYYTYKYDVNNRKIEMFGVNPKNRGNLFIKETFKYDSLGNITEEYSNGKVIKYTYLFNNENLLVEKDVIYINENIQSDATKHIFTYNTNNQCSLEVCQEGKRKTITNFTYDDLGNWILKKTKESEQHYYLEERTITYY